MNLNGIKAVKRPTNARDLEDWPKGHAWLAGGTWLFSEPQRDIETLVDLERLAWAALELQDDGLKIAATCKIAELHAARLPDHWIAAPLLRECCDCLLASFKIWNAATVGGNLCMSLPAGAMISLVTGLEGMLELWPLGGPPRQVPALDFVTGNHRNILAPGELLRSIHLPAAALSKRHAVRHSSLTKLGRSAALIIGTSSVDRHDLVLTITAATPRPVQLIFDAIPEAEDLRERIEAAVPADGWFDDVHGKAAYKRHLTHHFAEQIREELSAARTDA
ncbi:CO/xanthine dehydrogenase FAD-binding subunit [Rhodoligotrophos appendicifer]|uniref:FAD binding domain-containing protein n=1 Tax=Rhodoligotrophos appendicifer TaxID=987056 RepID=UPI0011852DFD|nr:FAD binding domain-containing protein [Rhodoligotrophos appendicifer]